MGTTHIRETPNSDEGHTMAAVSPNLWHEHNNTDDLLHTITKRLNILRCSPASHAIQCIVMC